MPKGNLTKDRASEGVPRESSGHSTEEHRASRSGIY